MTKLRTNHTKGFSDARSYLHSNSTFIAIQVCINHELSDSFDDLLQKGSLQNLCLKHIVIISCRNRKIRPINLQKCDKQSAYKTSIPCV